MAMSKWEINDLINSNSDIKEAYKAFRKQFPRNAIIDMYSMAHFDLPIIEVYIEYYDYTHNKATFEYYEEF